MENKLTINQKIQLHGKTYKVIGIDSYSLKNLLGKNKKWISYTLVDDKEDRTWISYGTAGDYFTQWAIIPQKEFTQYAKDIKMNLTGIAQISFQGNPGYSTPVSEIVWFNTSNNQCDCVSLERFLGQKNGKVTPLEPYYQSGKILKNFKT